MRKSRLSWYKQNRLIEYFMAGASARVAASLVGVNTSTASYYFHRLRVIISKKIDDDFTMNRNIDLTESGLKDQFGFLYNNQPLFFICYNEGKITTLFFSKVSGSITPTHSFASFVGGLVCTTDQRKSDVLDLSLCKLIKVDSYNTAINNNAIGDVESFWSFSKQHLQKLNGVYKKNITLYIAECEWRFNSNSLIKQLADLKSWAKSELC